MPDRDNAGAACPECGGRGWVIEPDGRAGSARRCGCRGRDAVERLLEAARIPPLYSRCTLDGFKTAAETRAERDQLISAVSRCRRYVDEFLNEDGSFSKQGLLFVGAPGVGKTHLASAVLIELIRRFRLRGAFVDFTDLIHRIQSTFDPTSDESKHQVLDPVTECDLLVLDELGSQQPTEWVKNTLYLILNTRYTRQLPTLFTTNYRLRRPTAAAAPRGLEGRETAFEERQTRVARGHDESWDLLENRLQPGLLSRLYEMAQVVEIDVGDYRREIKMQRHAG